MRRCAIDLRVIRHARGSHPGHISATVAQLIWDFERITFRFVLALPDQGVLMGAHVGAERGTL